MYVNLQSPLPQLYCPPPGLYKQLLILILPPIISGIFSTYSWKRKGSIEWTCQTFFNCVHCWAQQDLTWLECETAFYQRTFFSIGDPVVSHCDGGSFPADQQAGGGRGDNFQVPWNIRNYKKQGRVLTSVTFKQCRDSLFVHVLNIIM